MKIFIKLENMDRALSDQILTGKGSHKSVAKTIDIVTVSRARNKLFSPVVSTVGTGYCCVC